MREFTTAVREKRAEIEGDAFPFNIKVDDRVLSFRKPQEGEGTQLLVAMAPHQDQLSKFGSIIGIFFGLFKTSDRDYLNRRLMDPEDDFGAKYIVGYTDASGVDQDGMLQAMMEEWSGFPTQPVETSSESQHPLGLVSSPSTPASTSSPFPSGTS